MMWAGAAAWALFTLALNPWSVAVSHPDEVLSPESLSEVRTAQLLGGLAALGFVGLAFLARNREVGPGLVRVSLFLLFGLSPLVAVELGWAPYFERPSRLFQPDELLGWRLRADWSGTWLGVPVEINSHGVRGPERPLAAPEGTRRVLFLGDSVVFGFRIEEDTDTLPRQLEACLSANGPVEVVNAGVGGWSPWQAAGFLRTEGDRFAPDLVVLGFVLNDVTEKLGLARFGGEDIGFQLRNSRADSSLGWLQSTAWADVVRELVARFDVGASARQAAQERELLSVYDLIRAPEDPRVRAAWELTLPNVGAIREWCRERDVPLLVAVFPYTIQLYEQPGQDFGAPQARLAAYCAELDLPWIDLREPLLRAMREEGQTEFELYLDAVHPSPVGHAYLSAALCREIEQRAWLDD